MKAYNSFVRFICFLTSVMILIFTLTSCGSNSTSETSSITFTKTFGGSDCEFGRSAQQTSDGGYIIVGSTYSYGAGNYDVYLIKTDSSGNTSWTKTFGGSNSDSGYSVQQTSDGGYVIVGYTYSYGAGSADVYLIKTDSSGNTIWTKTFGGGRYDYGWSVQQTSDGGYIIAGGTDSYGAGNYDVYLIKTDSSGNTTWTKTFGDSYSDYGYSVQQTSDGGYVIIGYTYSYGAGYSDVYLIKTDSNGNATWTKTFGGGDWDSAYSVQQTSDGGYIIAGITYSYGAGSADVYLIKTDSSGNTAWTKTFGGSGYDYGYSVRQTSDGGYIVVGYTYSYGAGNCDVYLIKTDPDGNTAWTKTFGGSGYDFGYMVRQTSDGGYAIIGDTESSDIYFIKTDAEGNVRNEVGYSISGTITDSSGAGLSGVTVNLTDIISYTAITDANGDYIFSGIQNNNYTITPSLPDYSFSPTNIPVDLSSADLKGQDFVGIPYQNTNTITFTRTYGGNESEEGSSVQQTSDGGYIIVGYTSSYGAGNGDVYLIKTDSRGNTIWTKTIGGSDGDYGWSVQQTSDGGYIITGQTYSYDVGRSDVYLIKTDSSGNTQWTKTFGGEDYDLGYSVQQTSDGGYIIAGSYSYGGLNEDIYLIKTDSNGNAVWTKTFGESDDEWGCSVQQTSDGGYIIVGYANTDGIGNYDVYLIKTDSDGNTIWTKTFGGDDSDGGYSVQQTSDEGYIITGGTYSYGAGNLDIYLIKTDSDGNVLWTKTFGGEDDEGSSSVQQTSDGGYIIAGSTDSYGNGNSDVYLIKTDSSGNTTWTKTFGGGNDEWGESVQQTSDGGYIIAGNTTAGYIISYDTEGAGSSSTWNVYDIYLIKTDSSGNVH
ncbi:MAG: carboxypeptidase regulatory-like domain-containing protein [Nitrospirae bacterium]|nr:carboxypeptidase regulatory-like domain-containing protein [Nitrospirota bacterium]